MDDKELVIWENIITYLDALPVKCYLRHTEPYDSYWDRFFFHISAKYSHMFFYQYYWNKLNTSVLEDIKRQYNLASKKYNLCLV